MNLLWLMWAFRGQKAADDKINHGTHPENQKKTHQPLQMQQLQCVKHCTLATPNIALQQPTADHTPNRATQTIPESVDGLLNVSAFANRFDYQTGFPATATGRL